MSKLIIMCGVSGSGKSFYAHEQWKNHKNNTIIVNRDKIRELLYGYTEENVNNYYLNRNIRHLEEQVTLVEDILIDAGLDQDKTIIIDATHLKVSYLNRFDRFLAEKELVFCNITLKEAIIRDKSRVRRVGHRLITDQYNKYVNLRNFLTRDKLKFDYISQEINIL